MGLLRERALPEGHGRCERNSSGLVPDWTQGSQGSKVEDLQRALSFKAVEVEQRYKRRTPASPTVSSSVIIHLHFFISFFSWKSGDQQAQTSAIIYLVDSLKRRFQD